MQFLPLLQKLISCKSVTPTDDGAIEFISELLASYGFTCEIMSFSGNGSYEVKNLYARYGKKSPNLCFAGHTDVVPTGDIKAWNFDPFAGIVENDIIYGRGVVDMKGAIATMLSATLNFISSYKVDGSISFLITGDEEADGINGTNQVLGTLAARGEKLDACVVGEPTSTHIFADTIKIGRRGSITFNLKISGIQGHVAYPHNADNPITYLIQILNAVKSHKLDDGSQYFDSSNLEITTIDVGNCASNVIPAIASATFNIRFNDHHQSSSLISWVRNICDKLAPGKYEIDYRISGESFITHSPTLINTMQSAIKKVTGQEAELSTSGGTSDARFIKNYCPVIEFGLLNNTAHKVDECAPLPHLAFLHKIHFEFLKTFFNS